jgi:hypothetical protein
MAGPLGQHQNTGKVHGNDFLENKSLWSRLPLTRCA